MGPDQSADTVRVKRPHSEAGEYHEWVANGERWRYKDVGHTWWFEMVCNNPDCEGYAIVSEEALAALIDGGAGDGH